jgi:hypothetical protein
MMIEIGNLEVAENLRIIHEWMITLKFGKAISRHALRIVYACRIRKYLV